MTGVESSGARVRQGGLVAFALLATLLVVGCAPTTPAGYWRVRPTALDQAQLERPEEQLLDVGLVTSTPEEMSDRQMEKHGTRQEIRKAEAHFIPYHLKNTLQRSSHWGSVQVVPSEDARADLIVTSRLEESNGEVLRLEFEARDATGRVWFREQYHARLELEEPSAFDGTRPGERDAFQDLYNTVANELAAELASLTPEEIEEIRTVSELAFAGTFAPDVYGEYLEPDAKGRLTLRHLPADDDPHMERIRRIGERDAMFVDTLNLYYEGFYNDMWTAYEDWRRFSLTERVAKREIERSAALQTVAGIAMLAGGIAFQFDSNDTTSTLGVIMIGAGGAITLNGINVSQQAEIHAAAIRELGESFNAEMKPTVLELEGKQVELSGTAADQYAEWRALLRRIYLEEVGLDPDDEQYSGEFEPAASPAGL
jgi:hypothetical protein